MEDSKSGNTYLSGLNGLRSLAAGGVLVVHLNNVMRDHRLPVFELIYGGEYAVTVFFVLSGFLITFLLLKEKKSTGTVSIGKFYLRRVLRIWPLYFTYLGIALLFNFVSGKEYDHGLLVFYFLIAANFLNSFQLYIPTIPHLWSIGVEEQFYLMWPWFIRLFRKPIYFLIGFLLLFSLLKLVLRFWLGGVHPAYGFLLTTRFDCMAIGGIGAWLFSNGIPKMVQKWLFLIPVQILCWLVLGAALFDHFHLWTLMDHTIAGVLSVIVILNLVGNPKPLFRLENRFWRYIGGISFGIYIWHPVLQSANALLLPFLPLPDVGKIVFMIVAVVSETILLSHLSMKFLEGPFLRLKDRYGMVKAKMV